MTQLPPCTQLQNYSLVRGPFKFPNNPRSFPPKIFSQGSFTHETLGFVVSPFIKRSRFDRAIPVSFIFKSWTLRGTVDRSERCFTVIRDRSANRLTGRKNLGASEKTIKGRARRRRRPFGHRRLQKVQTATSIRTHARERAS